MDSNFAHQEVYIVDMGTAFTKFGVFGEEDPWDIIPTVFGYVYEFGGVEFYIGNRALRRVFLKLVWPMRNGEVVDWNAWEAFINLLFRYEMKIDPSKSVILFIEQYGSRMRDRIKKAEILFEIFNVSALYFSTQIMASLFFTKQISGLVIHSGESETYVAPIINGIPKADSIVRVNVTGADITKNLLYALTNRGYYIPERILPLVVKEIKERLCYVAINFADEVAKARSNPESVEDFYELPDGSVIKIGEERFMIPEIIFSLGNLAGAIKKSIDGLDEKTKKMLLSNIIVSGGNTMFRNFLERLKIALHESISPELKENIKINTHPERVLIPYYGAQILARTLVSRGKMLTREKWREEGINSVLRMF